jgi:hypothetical protein
MEQKFGMSWLERMRAIKLPGVEATTGFAGPVADRVFAGMHDTGAMGWRWQGGKRVGFACGNVLYREDGTEEPLAIAHNDELRPWYVPVGDPDVWLRACKLLTDRRRPELDVLIATAFAAPLMTFTGSTYGAILSVWGESGTGKTSAQNVAAAVWGHPKQTRESFYSTLKAVQGRLGVTCNLAAYWDDIQTKVHQDKLFQTMFVVARGSEGGKVRPNSNYKARGEWQTLFCVCSNPSFARFLSSKKDSISAALLRVFEFKLAKREHEPGLVNRLVAARTFAELDHNYGLVGAQYARMLACEHKAIETTVAETMDRFADKVHATSDESYWWGICGVLLAGATLARRLGADLDVPAMEAFLAKTFVANRQVARDGGMDYLMVEQGLVDFLNRCLKTNNVLVTDRIPWGWARQGKIEILRRPPPGQPIFVHIYRDDRKITISRTALRVYLNDGPATKKMMAGLKKFFRGRNVEHCPIGLSTLKDGHRTAVRAIDIRVSRHQRAVDELIQTAAVRSAA